jgi:tRNA-specific 2-thiouridylase
VYYTVGQRRGLFLNSPDLLYVVEIDAERNALVVGAESELYRTGLIAEEVSWVSIAPPIGSIRATVKIRYRAPEVGVTLERLDDSRVRALFDEPQKSVTPGQAAVFYDGDVLLGGGTIERALARSSAPAPVSAGD